MSSSFYKDNNNGIEILLTESPSDTQNKIKKAKKKTIIGWTIGAILIFVFVLNLIIMPLTGSATRKGGDMNGLNSYIVTDSSKLMLSAHRAGGGLEPEETKAAFRLCLESKEYKVDVLEFDLHLTKDNVLVLMHDHKIDRTSNGVEKFGKGVEICDLTLAELKTLNFGYNFQDPYTGEYPYRDLTQEQVKEAEVDIFTLDEILSFVENEKRTDKSMKYIIEIKDNNERGKTSMDLLYKAMEKYDILNRTVVGTFHGGISKYIDEEYGDKVARSSGIAEVLKIYYSFLYGVELNTDKLGFSVLQVPVGVKGYLDLSTKAFVDYCHSYGLAVQYWTINDYDEVIRLKDNGADCIMTDDPYMAAAALKRLIDTKK